MKLPPPGWPRHLPTSVVVGAATLGPVGVKLPAPGTWGSLAGLLYFTVFFPPLGLVATLLLAAAGLYVAVGFCGEAAARMRREDPHEVILDEFMAMPLCFLGWRAIAAAGWPHWEIFLAGFLLFRFYDILKPLGIRRLENLPGGWGIVVDDAAAALAACGTLHLGAWLWTLR
jgi:phosphatidylglycerophosphatase A